MSENEKRRRERETMRKAHERVATMPVPSETPPDFGLWNSLTDCSSSDSPASACDPGSADTGSSDCGAGS